jgi:hypothetical protein
LEGKGGRVSGERTNISLVVHRELRLSLPRSLQREGEEGSALAPGGEEWGQGVEWCGE